MDVHLHKSRALHYGLNDRPDDDLQFLSLEERECILFFEETIDSLEEEEKKTFGRAPRHSPVDQDIIDLVHPSPDPSKHTDSPPAGPDFQELIVPPESHFELKPKRELDVPDGLHDGFGHQPPAGSVPTPVVIASKIAEHQGAGGASASQLLQRRRSLESPTTPSAKHGPPTHTKPSRLPDGLGVLRSSREHIPHSIATEAVSVQERRAQALASLTGPAHPLDGGEPACVRNLPMRSISFRDPTPDKSRMEALSKLGLAQRRAQSVVQTSPRESENLKTGGNVLNVSYKASASGDVPVMDTTDHCQTRSSPAPTVTSAEVNHTDLNSYGSSRTEALSKVGLAQRPTQSVMHSSPRESTAFNISSPASASADAPVMDTTDHCQTRSSPAPALTSAEVTHSDFNSYGGKSITLPNNILQERGPFILSAQNGVCGDSQQQLWRQIASHDSVPAKPSAPNQDRRPGQRGPLQLLQDSERRRSPEESVVLRSAREAAARAPKPPRHQTPLSPTSSRPAPLSPELRRKSLPKPSFRTQGVTVQFSGRGATDEARRDALRKLGLLRNTS
ncbi:LOW QUALITY PROTEIN: proline and serine-rich protein 2 [Puntigrus tetrazona]|uniref:LOW QUALITY PROTEIN: proline and serine-rich protein 2 n=1 Tax=Puntigrus tetrazona TaxID=1606681 RepID=UPI001C8A5A18|nr:LOW QUALITY PROTEIN: proline and serine-rich protein 2 [Puntigrus tetrazona]